MLVPLGCMTWDEPLSFPFPHPDEGGVQRGGSPSSFPAQLCFTLSAAGLGVCGSLVGRGDYGETALGLDFAGDGGT